MKKYIFKNHQLIEEKQAQISVLERGFLFGDGIFETCKIFDEKIYDFKAHETRLKAGLKALKFSAEISDLEKKSLQLIKKNKIKNGILRISITRGTGSLGYLPTYESKALIIIQTFEERKITAKKIILGVSSIKKPASDSLPFFCKTNQALPSILCKIEAQEKKFFDCIMLSKENFISETSSANIFWVKNGKIFTPSKACDCLPGTIRAKLLKISPIKIKEVKAKISDLKKADEIFITNSSFLVLPADEVVLGKDRIKLRKKIGLEIAEVLKKDLS
jgi:branched-subunit amino acid aminotransferase/4-amino-4-deoxychorismate lyase